MSHELVSRYIAMVSERAEVNDVLDELFRAEGNEIHICDVAKLVSLGESCTFWDVLSRARLAREIVIGYMVRQEPGAQCNPTVLNPPDKGISRAWHEVADCFVTLAYD